MRFVALGLCLCLSLLSGCAPGKGKVSGQVTYRGKAVPGGLVTFRPADGQHNSVTVPLDADGRFPAVELPAGEVLVSIDNRELEPRPTFSGGVPPGVPLSPEAQAKLGKAKAAPPPPAADGPPQTGEDVRRPSGRYVPIPERYYDAETSGLKITVKNGQNQTETFELTD